MSKRERKRRKVAVTSKQESLSWQKNLHQEEDVVEADAVAVEEVAVMGTRKVLLLQRK